MRCRFCASLAGLVLALLLGSASAQVDDPARIDAPADGARVSGRVEVRGRATGRDPSRFGFYRVHYGQGASPSALRPVGPPGEQPVEGGRLADWDTTFVTPGEYLVLLTVYDTAGGTTTARVVVTVEQAPVLPRPADQPTPGVALPVETPTAEPTAEPAPEEALESAPPPPDLTPPAPVLPVDVAPPAPAAPPPVPAAPPLPGPSNPPPAPVQVEPVAPGPAPAPDPAVPAGLDPAPAPPPSFDPAAPAPPPVAPIVVPAPAPPPPVQPYELPTPQTLPPPTPFGL